MKILGAVLELPAKQHCLSSLFTSKFGQIGQNWQCFLASSSKMAPRIFIFSIAMDADNSFYVKSIASFALTFFGYITSVLASVNKISYCNLVLREKSMCPWLESKLR
jgi:hypothetical protein